VYRASAFLQKRPFDFAVSGPAVTDPLEVLMFDYSLELYRSVPAVAGESYKLVRFGTGSAGLRRGRRMRHRGLRSRGRASPVEGIDQALQQVLGVGASGEVVMVVSTPACTRTRCVSPTVARSRCRA